MTLENRRRAYRRVAQLIDSDLAEIETGPDERGVRDELLRISNAMTAAGRVDDGPDVLEPPTTPSIPPWAKAAVNDPKPSIPTPKQEVAFPVEGPGFTWNCFRCKTGAAYLDAIYRDAAARDHCSNAHDGLGMPVAMITLSHSSEDSFRILEQLEPFDADDHNGRPPK